MLRETEPTSTEKFIPIEQFDVGTEAHSPKIFLK